MTWRPDFAAGYSRPEAGLVQATLGPATCIGDILGGACLHRRPGHRQANRTADPGRRHQSVLRYRFRPLDGRPGLQALLAAAGTGDALAVVRLDRLGRTINALPTTVATLKQRGIALICLDEQVDTRTADGGPILHRFGALARCERRLAGERTQTRLMAAIAYGKRRGRRPLDTDKITAALKLVESGLSPGAVATQLRLGRSKIYREVNRAGIERVSPSR